MKKKQKVFVGISGGVDSSVSAYLLLRQGYEVHGVYIKPWSPDWLPCNWISEKRDAMRVCAKLNIPFHFLNGEETYKNEVAEYMISEYKEGRTPNPDILCNRSIKFGLMWQYAKSSGADYIATGHYARTDGRSLMKAVDKSKDQSYFLWMLTKDDLAHIKFPIGGLKKIEVRKIAKIAGLHTSTKKDSQGICFLGDIDLKDFLSHYIEQRKGDVVLEDGRVIGSHKGVWFYTTGERHGFEINEKNSNRKIYYVTGKNIPENKLIVSDLKFSENTKKTATIDLKNSNWIAELNVEKNYTSQFRYHGKEVPVEILSDTSVKINTEESIPKGQSIVLYEKDLVVGGGIIS